mgnify:CR=1 FL=1
MPGVEQATTSAPRLQITQPSLHSWHSGWLTPKAITASVAAASIVAKVTRDRMMDRYHRRFPVYGFDRNRGYGTPEHRAAIREHGPSPIHRRSFTLLPPRGLFD